MNKVLSLLTSMRLVPVPVGHHRRCSASMPSWASGCWIQWEEYNCLLRRRLSQKCLLVWINWKGNAAFEDKNKIGIQVTFHDEIHGGLPNQFSFSLPASFCRSLPPPSFLLHLWWLPLLTLTVGEQRTESCQRHSLVVTFSCAASLSWTRIKFRLT